MAAAPQKVINVLRVTREGISKKNNKPYQIVSVMVEDGTEVEVFGPVKQGDMVDNITFNSQYNKLQGQVVKADKNSELLNDLSAIRQELIDMNKKLDKLLNPMASDVGPKLPSPAATQPLPTPYQFSKPTPLPLVDEEPPFGDEDRPDDLIEEGYAHGEI